MKEIIKIDNQEFNLDKENETFFATQEQIANIFQVDSSVVSRHLKNIFECGELDKNSNLQKMQNTFKPIYLFSLDSIISVGYRVNSVKAVEFRKKATKILKEYLTTGEVKKKEYSKLEIAKMLYESEIEKEKLAIENNKKQEIIDEYIKIDNNKTYTETAKVLHLKPRAFVEKLRNLDYISLKNIPYQRYIDCGYFYIKKTINNYGSQTKHFESYLITPRGFDYFLKQKNKGIFDTIKI